MNRDLYFHGAIGQNLGFLLNIGHRLTFLNVFRLGLEPSAIPFQKHFPRAARP
jgi:hypothetical protein